MVSGNVFQIGSMTKQFTAIAVLILESQGKLKVSDPVSKYIPDYTSGNSIAIHQLLTHISGIQDFTKMKSLSEIAHKEMPTKAMVDFFKNEPGDFKPGEKFDYNNSGYVLLGYIIELVQARNMKILSGIIFSGKQGWTILIMPATGKLLRTGHTATIKSNGYVNKTIISFSVPFASGSLMSTVEDMVKWQNAINKNLILDTEYTKKAFTRYKLNSGTEFTYGYGWHLKDINGIPTREHGGSIFGFKSMGIYIPDEDIYVIGFSNCDCHSPTQIVKDMAKTVLKESKK